MKKKQLRKEFLARQMALSSGQRKLRNEKIEKLLFQTFDFSDFEFLHIFHSIEEMGEIKTSRIINTLWEECPNLKLVAPRVSKKRDRLENIQFDANSTFCVSEWGIPEPEGVDLIDDRLIDAVLVPLVCFDQLGERVGHGKGYYDKFLSNCRQDVLKIGLSYFRPIEKIDDIEDFDIRLDACVTPEKIFEFEKRK